jgi:exo-beta-1,3-glucanase (GH17 family)
MRNFATTTTLFFLWTLLFGSTSLLCLVSHAAPIQLYGLNYNTRQGPDWDWDKCKSYERILQDLQLLRRVTSRIRLLSMTDCGQGDMVLTVANEVDMQVYLGLWVGPDHATANKFQEEIDELQRVVEKFLVDGNNGNRVLGVTVGSEAIYREDATEEELIDYMNQVKDLLASYNLNLPVSIVDIAPEYSERATLREAVDVIYTNTFPFWEATPIDDAMQELENDLGWLIDLPESQGKPFILGETGWPAGGFLEGVGEASPENQAQYFADSYCFLNIDKGWDTFWFTGIDNAWRQEQDPNNTVEGTFGFLTANLTLKDHFQNLEFTCSDGVTYSFAEMDWSIPELTTAPPATLDPASCAAHTRCLQLDLPGMCCPTGDGVVLGCCGGDGGGLGLPPAAAPVTTDSPTVVATMTTTSTAPPEASPAAATLSPTSATTTEGTDGIGGTSPVQSPTTPMESLVPVAIPGISPTLNPNNSLPTSFGSASPATSAARETLTWRQWQFPVLSLVLMMVIGFSGTS